ncbi:MAG: hypothetical protein ACLRZ5_11885 [Ruminococcus sp.]
MLLLEGMDTLEILDQSFYQAFPNGDKKLLAAYTDVALNGGKLSSQDLQCQDSS